MSDDERRTIVRDGLLRTVPFTMERAAEGGAEGTDGLTLEGHAAVFNSPTLIDSWEGRFYEQIARGAFRKTFSERTPVLQFDHGRHPLVGSIPIGRIRTAKEDQTGAYVKARLADNWLIQPVRDAIANESINGMSFRFEVVREEWRDSKGKVITDPNELIKMMWGGEGDPPTRTLREIKVPELGPVVFPAYASTDVAVRSGQTVIDLGRLRADPAERQKLARTLWMAEQEPEPPADEHKDLATGGVIGPLTLNITVDSSRSPEEVAQEVADALTRAIGARTAGKADTAHVEAPTDRDNTDSAAPQGTGTDQEPPDDTVVHRSDPAPDDVHAEPAPASERHADEDGEPPEGHSSTAANLPAVDTREKRRSTLAYLRELHSAGLTRQALYEKTVAQYEADGPTDHTEG